MKKFPQGDYQFWYKIVFSHSFASFSKTISFDPDKPEPKRSMKGLSRVVSICSPNYRSTVRAIAYAIAYAIAHAWFS